MRIICVGKEHSFLTVFYVKPFESFESCIRPMPCRIGLRKVTDLKIMDVHI
jgi:NADH:ubiquinone oxidoreductase subunit F (NADH-binding)